MNIRPVIGAIAAGCLALAVSGCSKPGAPLSSAITRPVPLGCDSRMLKLDDFAGILSAPLIDQKSLPGDAQTCQFLTGGFPAITVSVRPDVGHATVDAWNTGKMPFPVATLAEVGDQAVWQDTLHEVIAQKNNLLCDIEIRGGDGDIAATVDALPGMLGALCSKLFAAFGREQ